MKTYTITINDKEYEVLGCPFCDSIPEINSDQIKCVNLYCDWMPLVVFPGWYYDSIELRAEKAINEWNARA